MRLRKAEYAEQKSKSQSSVPQVKIQATYPQQWIVTSDFYYDWNCLAFVERELTCLSDVKDVDGLARENMKMILTPFKKIWIYISFSIPDLSKNTHPP